MHPTVYANMLTIPSYHPYVIDGHSSVQACTVQTSFITSFMGPREIRF